jgi:MerR family mercuric resistance operon transcriptional regulator
MHTMTIGQVARHVGIGVETVRFYERKGLLDAPPRRESGYRQYAPDVIRRLQFIKRAKELGFSLKEITELLSLRVDPETTCGEVKQRAEAKMADIDAKLRDLRRMQEALAKLVAACSGSSPTSHCPILDALESHNVAPELSGQKGVHMRSTFDVKGMHCEGCANRIKAALQKFPAITRMEVDHRRDLVAIEHQNADLEAVAMAMARLGFTVAQT